MPNLADNRPRSPQAPKLILSDAHRKLKRLRKKLLEGRFQQVERETAKLLKAGAENVEVIIIRASALLSLGHVASAESNARKAQGIDPNNAAALNIVAQCALLREGEDAHDEVYRTFLGKFSDLGVRCNFARSQMLRQQHIQALETLQSGLDGANSSAELFYLIGECFHRIGQLEKAKNSYDLGLACNPDFTDFFIGRHELAKTRKEPDARIYLLQALEVDPGFQYALLLFLRDSLGLCDWDSFDAYYPTLALTSLKSLGDEPPSSSHLMALCDDPELSQRAQRSRSRRFLDLCKLKRPARVDLPNASRDGRIRLGYFSSDLYNHATLDLLTGVLRCHDRSKFELFCFDYGYNDARSHEAKNHFDHVFDLRYSTSPDIAQMARTAQLDIAVDLKGDTSNARPNIFLLGLAPVQINYLGFPGTMGSTAYDYMIADEVVVPESLERFFDEKLIRLPTCYLPSDDRRRARLPPTRTELGLPETGVVLACLNDPYKISREVFSIWLNALKAVPDAVLWLWEKSETASEALRQVAQSEGIASDRIVFAESVDKQDHHDRLAQADLYLDTFNVNGHTLSSDAICSAGVPVLTKAGRQFAARVGASFCVAAGLPEMVVETSEDYFRKLVELASDREELLRLRGTIALNRSSLPMFSSQAYTAYLEQAFLTAHNRARQGKSAKSFNVLGLPSSVEC